MEYSVSTLKTNSIQPTTGSTVSIPGHVVQTVNAVTTTRNTTTSTSYVTAGITASITPKSASNKILISVSTSGNVNNASSHHLYYTLYRDSTNIGDSNYGLGEIRGISVNIRAPINVSYVDSPNTTSSTTYTLFFKTSNASSTVEIPGNAGQKRSITLQEIAQ